MSAFGSKAFHAPGQVACLRHVTSRRSPMLPTATKPSEAMIIDRRQRSLASMATRDVVVVAFPE